jgi:hypothetical protein
VIFAPLLKSIAFGPHVYGAQGLTDAYCVLPALGMQDGVLTFKEGAALNATILHESAHAFVNPAVHAHGKALSACAFLMRKIEEVLAKLPRTTRRSSLQRGRQAVFFVFWRVGLRPDRSEGSFAGASEYKTGAQYGAEWRVCVCEHLVRAVTTRLACRALGEADGEREMQAHAQQGFAYVAALCDRLREYERCRQTYPSIWDFFPRILDAFEELSRA